MLPKRFGRNFLTRLWRDSEQKIIPKAEIEVVRFPSKPQKLALGAKHGLGLVDGRVFAFGCNGYGQCGPLEEGFFSFSFVGDDDAEVPHPLVVKAIEEPVTDIQCGDFHNMALLSDGKVFSWGAGILGQGDEVYETLPRPLDNVNALGNCVGIAASSAYSLLTLDTGRVMVFGYLDTLRGRSKVLSPVTLTYLTGVEVKKLVAGRNHFTVLDGRNRLLSFGNPLSSHEVPYSPMFEEIDEDTEMRQEKPFKTVQLDFPVKELFPIAKGNIIISEDGQVLMQSYGSDSFTVLSPRLEYESVACTTDKLFVLHKRSISCISLIDGTSNPIQSSNAICIAASEIRTCTAAETELGTDATKT